MTSIIVILVSNSTSPSSLSSRSFPTSTPSLRPEQHHHHQGPRPRPQPRPQPGHHQAEPQGHRRSPPSTASALIPVPSPIPPFPQHALKWGPVHSHGHGRGKGGALITRGLIHSPELMRRTLVVPLRSCHARPRSTPWYRTAASNHHAAAVVLHFVHASAFLPHGLRSVVSASKVMARKDGKLRARNRMGGASNG